MKKTTLLILGILAVGALAAGWFLLRPIFFSSETIAAPTSFKEAEARMAFVDVAQEAGFTHVHHKTQLDPVVDPIMPWLASVGSAACAGDFDNDGWMDLYVTNTRKGKPNMLYRNLGNGAFEDVAAKAGVAAVNNDSGVATDVAWGDYDNDGWLDLYVVKWGKDVLFRNNGDGTFSDVTAAAFPNNANPWANGCAVAWFDYDRDGLLDLYVGNYFAPFDLWNLEHTNIMHDDFETSRNAGANFMFRNNGDGTFSETGRELGLDDPGWTLSVGHGDVNNDGWPDLYNANDFGSDQLFLNRKGRFENVTDRVFGGDTKKGMNVDFGDFDGNGWLDIYVTNITTAEYLREGNMLWHNDADDEDGVPIFLDISVDSGTYDGGWGWGGKFFDFDNDGDLDIATVNGFITAGPESYWYDLASWTVTGDDVTDALNWPPIGDRSFSGNEATRLFRNDGGRRFTEIAEEAGVASRADGRGVVTFDYDNDGDLDLYVANQGFAPNFYRNNVGERGNWLILKLTGAPEAGSNRDAIGARVTVVTAEGAQIRELDGGNSFCGQSDRRIHFGLGDAFTVSAVEIRWPSGNVQSLRDVRANQILAVQEEPAQSVAASALIPTSRDTPPIKREPAQPAAAPAESEALLSSMESKIREQPDNMVVASKYRARCIALGQHERSVAFFEQLAREQPENRSVRLHLAGAYVDKIPTCGGMAAIVSKGTLARQALDQLDLLLSFDQDWWPALYSRAMNHLHWPRALRHSDDAARDFQALIDLQAQSDVQRSYYVRAYIGLGDALAKDDKFEEARDAWREGLAKFPNHPELLERTALKSSDEARAYIEDKRNLERQVDTDFSFLVSP